MADVWVPAARMALHMLRFVLKVLLFPAENPVRQCVAAQVRWWQEAGGSVAGRQLWWSRMWATLLALEPCAADEGVPHFAVWVRRAVWQSADANKAMFMAAWMHNDRPCTFETWTRRVVSRFAALRLADRLDAMSSLDHTRPFIRRDRSVVRHLVSGPAREGHRIKFRVLALCGIRGFLGSAGWFEACPQQVDRRRCPLCRSEGLLTVPHLIEVCPGVGALRRQYLGRAWRELSVAERAPSLPDPCVFRALDAGVWSAVVLGASTVRWAASHPPLSRRAIWVFSRALTFLMAVRSLVLDVFQAF